MCALVITALVIVLKRRQKICSVAVPVYFWRCKTYTKFVPAAQLIDPFWCLLLVMSYRKVFDCKKSHYIQGIHKYHRLMRISWTEHRTNQSILDELSLSRQFLTTIQCRKLKYFCHVVRAENLSTDILHGRISGIRSRGRPKRRLSDDAKDWTGLSIPECITMARDRTAWRSVVSSSPVFSLQKWGRTNNNNKSLKKASIFQDLESPWKTNLDK